jgi:hypothetical protein
MFGFNILGLDAKVKTFFYFFMLFLQMFNNFLSLFKFQWCKN